MMFILISVILILAILLGFIGWLFLVYFRSYTRIVEKIYKSDNSQNNNFEKEIEDIKKTVNKIGEEFSNYSSNNNAILNEWLNGGGKVE